MDGDLDSDEDLDLEGAGGSGRINSDAEDDEAGDGLLVKLDEDRAGG